MKIWVNGEERELGGLETVADLLGSMEIDATQGGIAVAVNQTIVTRARLAETRLAPGDRVEIVHAVQGG
jgi:sulfur carrier protein